MQEMETVYKKSGFAQSAVGAIVSLIIGVSVATLIMIFTGSLGGQTYQLVEPDINAITNANISSHIKNAISNGFQAQETTSKYVPIIVLAVVISIVLFLVLSFGGIGRMGGSGGAL